MTPEKQAAIVREIIARRAQYQDPADLLPGKKLLPPTEPIGEKFGPVLPRHLQIERIKTDPMLAKFDARRQVDEGDFLRPGRPKKVSFTPRQPNIAPRRENTPLEAQALGRGMVKPYAHVGVPSSREREGGIHSNVMEELKNEIRGVSKARLDPEAIAALRAKIDAELPREATAAEEGEISTDLPSPEDVKGPSEAGIDRYIKDAMKGGISEKELDKIREFIASNPRIMRMHIGEANEEAFQNALMKNGPVAFQPKTISRDENVPYIEGGPVKEDAEEGSFLEAAIEAGEDINPGAVPAAVHMTKDDERIARNFVRPQPYTEKPGALAKYRMTVTPSMQKEQKLLKYKGPLGREKKQEFLKEAKTRLNVRKYEGEQPPKVNAALAEARAGGPPEGPGPLELGPPAPGLPVKFGPHRPALRAHMGTPKPPSKAEAGQNLKDRTPEPTKEEKTKLRKREDTIREALEKQRPYLYKLSQAEKKRKGKNTPKTEPRKGGEFARVVPAIGRFPARGG